MLHRLLQQHLSWLVALLLVLCAYFQARGINALVDARYLPEPEAIAAVPEWPPPQPSAVADAPNAQPILERNPFDSFTGPLDEKHQSEPPAPPPVTDPLRAPKCEGVRVESTAQARDPTWSSAVVQAPDEERGKLRRVGDPVGALKVAYIGYNHLDASPTVWFVEDQTLCQAQVFDEELKPAPSKKRSRKRKARPKKPKTAAHRRRSAGPPKLPSTIARKIRRVSATEFLVDRRAVDLIMEQQATLMKSIRLRPSTKSGRVEGLTVSRVRPDTLLGRLGIRNGDQIRTLNGFSLTSPEKALEAYSRMRTASELDLVVLRAGKPVKIEYRIR